MRIRSCLAVATLGVPVLAHAQSYTVEELSRITDQHVTRFDAGSASRSNAGVLSFDVRVDWKMPDARPEGAPPFRVVRYLVRCEEKELAVGMVTLYDEYRQVAKRVGVPPGAWEFSRPSKGTQAARWVEDVCDMPL